MPRLPFRLVRLCCLALAVALAGLLAGPARADAADGSTWVRTVEWQQADGRWSARSLPAGWQAEEAERLRLRATVRLDAPPSTVWGLRFDRLPPDHDLRLNGQRLSGQPLGTHPALPRAVVSQWITVPPSLLRAGDNLVEIDFDLHRYPGGLSAFQLGPTEVVEPAYRRHRLLGEGLPFGLNLAVAGLALFTLLVWWMRRSERLMGFFGMLMLLVSLRNLAYYSPAGMLPAPTGSLLFYLAQCLTAGLLGAFTVVQTLPGPHRRALAWVWGSVGLLALVGLGAMALDRLPGLRGWVYPPVIAANLWCAWRLWRAATGLSPAWRRGLVVGGALMLVCAVHDHLFNAAVLPVDGVFWMPYATPVTMVAVAWLLLRRFVSALNLAERQGQELERRVAERTRDLQAANAAKTRFVAAASHDLRQPVAAIGLLAGLLREQPLAGSARPLLDRLGEGVTALERLLRGLLDLSRFDAGSVVVRSRLVPLQALFDAVDAHEREAAARKGLSLRWRGGSLAVHGDPVLLEQVVRNLVNNAVRYTDRGGVLVSARRRGRSEVLLQVRDTGYGIPADRQSAVFDEFVQLDNPAREAARGMGLGLSLVRRAVDLMAVPMQLWSQPGRGSCFSLRLPHAEQPLAREAARPPTPVSLAGRRLVVVDDDEGVRESLRLRLEGWGATVQAYASLQALCEALARSAMPLPPHLLLSDQRLPDGDSRAVAEAVQAVHGQVPVLVVTGDTAPADLARLDALGWPVLHKPFGADALFEAVLRQLRR